MGISFSRVVSRASAARNTAAVGARRELVPVVLGQVKRVEAALLGALQERDALFVDLLRRLAPANLDVIKVPNWIAIGEGYHSMSRNARRP